MSAVISFTVFLICLLILMATRTPVAVALSMVTVAGTAVFALGFFPLVAMGISF